MNNRKLLNCMRVASIVGCGLLAASLASAGEYDEVWVTIQPDCTVSPADPVILNAPAGPGEEASGITMVRWKLAEGMRGVAKIVPKVEGTQDGKNPGRGKRIQEMFLQGGEKHINVTSAEGVARKPLKPWEVQFLDDGVVFQYSVEIPGVCEEDPQVCVRRQGSGGCSI